MDARVSTSNELRALSRPPRDVFRRRGWPVPLRCFVFLLVPHVWAGVFLLWLFVNLCGLALFAQEQTGIVTSRQYVQTNRRSRSRIKYVYNDSNGRHAASVLFNSSAYRTYPPGSKIMIRSFTLLGHKTIRPGPPDSVGVIVFAAFFVILWDGIVLASFYAVCLAPLGERRLLRDGVPALGQITEKKIIPRKKSNLHKLTYAYSSEDGTPQTNTKVVKVADFHLAETGDEVLVFYNPLKPTKSVLYPYSDYALRELER